MRRRKHFRRPWRRLPGIPETTVSPVTRGVVVPATSAAQPEIRIAPPEPAGSPVGSPNANIDELPLAVHGVGRSAGSVISRLTPCPERRSRLRPCAGRVPGESEAPSPGDSPREVARKMIAAREVRKRQVRKKTEIGHRRRLDGYRRTVAATGCSGSDASCGWGPLRRGERRSTTGPGSSVTGPAECSRRRHDRERRDFSNRSAAEGAR